jgi:CBS domain-containing protein
VKSVVNKRSSTLHWVRADATALDALQMMAEHDLGAVPVLDGGRLIGLFSERDYARRTIGAAQLPASMPLRAVMTTCDIFAKLSDSVQECVGAMIEHHLRYMPVRDGDTLVAVLSLDEFLYEMVAYLERVFKENELDQQIVFLRGTYSC